MAPYAGDRCPGLPVSGAPRVLEAKGETHESHPGDAERSLHLRVESVADLEPPGWAVDQIGPPRPAVVEWIRNGEPQLRPQTVAVREGAGDASDVGLLGIAFQELIHVVPADEQVGVERVVVSVKIAEEDIVWIGAEVAAHCGALGNA